MPRRLARLLLRVAGWLLTPLVLILAAAIGAFAGLLIAPNIAAPNTALAMTGGLALVAAIIGLVWWLRLLRHHPGLRHTLDLTVEGTPDSPLVQSLIHPDSPKVDSPP